MKNDKSYNMLNNINYRNFQSKIENDFVKSELNDNLKYEKIKSDFKTLETISTKADAKKFMLEILPVLNNCNTVKIADAVCTVFETYDKYRIILDSEQEMFYYDFK